MTEFKRKNVVTPRLKRWLIVLGIVLLFVATCAMTMLAPCVNEGFECKTPIVQDNNTSLTHINMVEWDVSTVNNTNFMMLDERYYDN